VLGVDPKLVLVFELGARVDPDEFRRAGLRILDSSNRRMLVAFSDDPQLAGFMERLDACAAGVPPGARAEPYAGFVDAVDEVRALTPDDRISGALATAVAKSAPSEVLRLDAELWHPDDHDLAFDWVTELRQAVALAGGHVADVHVNDLAGVILARIYVPADQVRVLAGLDAMAMLDVLPRPALTIPQLHASDPDSLPRMLPPRPDAPLVGLIDSGVASAHPLVGPAVVAAESLSPWIADGEDRCGHGTMVAGLILHGPVDRALAAGLIQRPLCRILSVAVLDSSNQFPDADLWERDLIEAIEWCAAQGAKIINLSVGDDRRALRSPRQLPAAALVDEIARRLDLVVVIASGNIRPADYLATIDEECCTRYPSDLLADSGTRVLDPATSALGLTVGGLTDARAATGYSSRETLLRKPFGEPGWPSPITRRGPGVGKSVKPELVERGGTLGYETGRIVGNDPELGIISTQLAAGTLLGFESGTSFAAPLVTRIATAVKARHPAFTANMVRALVLLSAKPPTFTAVLEGGTPADRAEAERNLLGYGQPILAQAIESTSHRAVLIAEATLPMDGVHIYELPVPSSFFESGGDRGIDIALAFNPRTRQSRLDYLSNRIDFALFRGMSLDEVRNVVARVAGDEDVVLEQGSGDEGAEVPSPDPLDGDAPASPPPTLSELRSKVVRLNPASKVRSAGANQLGRVTLRQRLDPQRHTPMFIAIRNVNRWENGSASQPYALAVALWRSADRTELYAELEAQLEAVVEVPIEVEVEVEV
jgi:hypothetical protein